MQDEREPVRLPLDTRAVQNWLSAHGQAFKDVRVLAQFGAGQSNPTYLLQARALWWLEGTRLEETRCLIRGYALWAGCRNPNPNSNPNAIP